MTRNDITLKVRQRLDEVGVNEIVSLNYPIDPFIDEATNQLQFDLPINLAGNIVDFSTNELIVTDNREGKVALPSGFAKLVEFKIEGWMSPISHVSQYSEAIFLRESNPITQANAIKPLLFINVGYLHYISTMDSDDHKIEIAKAQVYGVETTNYPNYQADMLSWLVASKVLQVMNESTLSNQAHQQYLILLNGIKNS